MKSLITCVLLMVIGVLVGQITSVKTFVNAQSTVVPAMDSFLPTTTQQVFTLSRVPGRALVFRNGLLEYSPIDYTITVGTSLTGTEVATLTFTGQTIGPNDIVQVQYW